MGAEAEVIHQVAEGVAGVSGGQLRSLRLWLPHRALGGGRGTAAAQ